MLAVHGQRNALMGQGNNLAKVSTALLNIDKQALNEAKEKFPMVTKGNQAAFDAFIKKRSTELKMANPLTKEYANLNNKSLKLRTSPELLIIKTFFPGIYAKIMENVQSLVLLFHVNVLKVYTAVFVNWNVSLS
jgi:hypothetical protein